MASTSRLGIALVEAAQSQKHVTVNEALQRLDAVAARVVASFGGNVPPAAPGEGEAHVVGAEPSAAWAGHDGEVAIFLNGGWDFMAPWAGLELWQADGGGRWVHDGAGWGDGAIGLSPGGAVTSARVIEYDHALAAGASSTTAGFIPDKGVVIGITARVTEAIGGAASWRLGTVDDSWRYGSGIGTGAGSYAHGVTGSPLAYYGGTGLVLTAEGGAFSGGRVLLAAHVLELSPPRA